MLDELEEDHRTWLLVASNNYLGQQRVDRAIVLLELLELLDPEDTQCLKLLAYAYWLEGDAQRFADVADRVLGQPISDAERAALRFMSLNLKGDSSVVAPSAEPARSA